MTSPIQTFDVAACVTFWYYLYSSNPQPHTTSAQLWVYLHYEDSSVKELLWFDHVNREIRGWLLGGIPVPGQRPLRLLVTGSTYIPYDSYTGAVSFDNVKYAPWPCNITEPVQVSKDGHVAAFYYDALANSHIRRPVCADNVTRLVADRICVLAVDAITTYSAPVQNAVTVTSSGTALSGLHLAARRECFPVRIQCRQPVCGTRAAQDTLVSSYVLFGQDARVEDWPWTAVLIGQGYLLCTAVLIHPEWVLTAAHCLHELPTETEYSVVLAVDSVFTSGDWIQKIRVTKIYEIGYIDEPYHTKDIAILRLEHPALLSDYTRPVCLPSPLLPVGGVTPLTSATTVYDAYVDAECYVTGHGATEDIFDDPFSPISPARQLQRKRVHLVPPELCRTTWLQENGYYDFANDVICIASEGPGAPTCFGDSGGPLVCRRGTGSWELLGIISFGFGNCLHDVVPSVTASVPAYYGWITDFTDVV